MDQEYRVRPQDGPQEMERNEATAKYVTLPSCAWLLLHFISIFCGPSCGRTRYIVSLKGSVSEIDRQFTVTESFGQPISESGKNLFEGLCM